MKKLPDELLEEQPHLAEEPNAEHPENGPALGPPPARYSRALHDQIISLIKAGNRPHVAAGMAGLPSSTFSHWMQRGKSGDPHLALFFEEVELAQHCHEGDLVEIVQTAAKTDPEYAKWKLERSRPDGYSKQVNMLVENQQAAFMAYLEKVLDAETFEKVLVAYAGRTNLLTE